jgi:hypothetical protein
MGWINEVVTALTGFGIFMDLKPPVKKSEYINSMELMTDPDFLSDILDVSHGCDTANLMDTLYGEKITKDQEVARYEWNTPRYTREEVKRLLKLYPLHPQDSFDPEMDM